MTDPYLSLVVTARNDDHGGNLLGRMQIFVNGWIEQARRYGIRSELIIVEWNPPPDRPRLADALSWPTDFGPCDVRIIEVPPELHRRYPHSNALPLYQMIGKNVGIRRALGKFVLATNIDLLFSNELADFLAKENLNQNCMYRIDRYDAMSSIPPGASLDEQIEYCRTHLIRVNRREGTFPASLLGEPDLSESDVAVPGSGISFGAGWFPLEWSARVPFRWAQEQAEIVVGPKPASVIVIELEPGPGTGGAPLDLEISVDENSSLGRVSIDSRSELRVPLPTPTPNRVVLRTIGAVFAIAQDPRILCLRVFRIRCEHRHETESMAFQQVLGVRRAGPLRRITAGWVALQYLIHKLAIGGPLVQLTVPVSPRLSKILRIYIESGGFTGMLRKGFRKPTSPAVVNAEASPTPEGHHGADSPAFLHTNACGDFTLLARDRWFDVRGYAEFDVYSMNLDSVLCYTAHYAGAIEETLREPMRIYHIEHGSGWTPEGYAELFARLAAKGITFVPNDEVLGWASQMKRLNSPIIFNHENWGLSDFCLRETVLPARETS